MWEDEGRGSGRVLYRLERYMDIPVKVHVDSTLPTPNIHRYKTTQAESCVSEVSCKVCFYVSDGFYFCTY